MEYKILEQNGIENENIDGGALNNLASNGKSGVVAGVLNECSITSQGNVVSVNSGLLLIKGIRVKLLSSDDFSLPAIAGVDTTYYIVAKVVLSNDRSVSFEMFLTTEQARIQENLYKNNSGIYELELGTFVHSNDKIINLKRTVEVINNSTQEIDIQVNGTSIVKDGVANIMIDNELSDTSENPVQNKVIAREIQGIKGLQLQLGETSNTAYAGDKGAILAQVLGISFGGQKNLFDKNTVELTAGLIMGNNTVVANSNISHFLFPVEIGKTYTFPIYYRQFGYAAAYNVPCYNSAGEFLGRITGTPTADNAYLTFTNTDTVYSEAIWGNVSNAGVAYIKLNVATAIESPTLDTFMIVEGDTYPNNYIPYGNAYTYNNPFENNPLTNKKIVFIGDSICAGTTDETGVRGWAQRIGEKNKMDWINLGVNGATITDGITGVNMYIVNADFGENPDYIILEGGTNDADLIGTWDDFTPEKYGNYNMFDFTGNFDKTTFCGAVENLFKRLTTDYAGVKIGFIIAHKMGFINSATDYTAEKSRRRFYFETIIKLCEKWGIPYIDLWNGCYLNPMNPAHNTANTNLMYVGDYQHLASKGYDYISPMIESWIKTL